MADQFYPFPFPEKLLLRQSARPPERRRQFPETDLRHSLGIPVKVNENGKSKRVSTQTALLLRAREKALKGENRALENLLDLARMHNTPENVTIGGGQQDEDGNQMDLRRLTDEELKELDRIMTKAYGISSDPPSRDTIGLPPSRCDRAERN